MLTLSTFIIANSEAVSSFFVFFLCHSIFTAYCLLQCGIIQLCYFDFLFSCFSPSVATITANS